MSSVRGVTGAAGLRRFKPYPAYRQSGVEWLGEIPADWEVKPLKHLTRFTTGWTPPSGRDDLYGGDHLWANISDLGPKVLYTTEKTISDRAIQEARMRVAAAGSLLFSFKLSVGAVSLAGVDMYTNEAIAAFAPSERIATGYLYWAAPALVPNNAQDNIYGAPLLSRERIANATLLSPPIGEQRAIAAFLDRETAQIDALVAKKERLIELLQEKRTAVITRAVTKGLDPSVPMRDSGVEWLGEIPAPWKVTTLRYACLLLRDGTHQPPQRVADGYPLLSVRNIVDGAFTRLPDDSMISETDFRNLERSFAVRENDVLLAVVGATLGKVAIVGPMEPFTIQRSLAVLRPRAELLHHQYFAHSLESAPFQSLLWKTTGFSAQPGIYLGTLASFHVPVPPEYEQSRILDFLRPEILRLDGLIHCVHNAIDRLKELRTALVSAAVTGKMDVRGGAVQ